MTADSITSGLQLRSLITASGELEISLARVDVPEPAAEEVVVQIRAAPINPSDLGLLVGAGDMTKATSSGSGDNIVVKSQRAAGRDEGDGGTAR